jgi:secreted trypsin-like serine protease
VRKTLALLAVLAAALVIGIVPASAITDGELDGNGHPAVVLVVMDIEGTPAFRCSGTLIAPTFVLTAGHCAGEPGEFSGIRVFTESDVENGTNNFPFAGPNAVEAVRWAAHPQFTNAAFFLHDAGMIQLAQPVNLASASYGVLPDAGDLDALKTRRGKQDVTFTSVGYGVQQINPVFVQQELVRMVAHPRLIQINVPGFVGGFSMLLSNNHSTGGTCFGDSGGPNYLGSSNVVAGITSFGINGNCAGTGGVFRTDKQDVVDFVDDFMNP